MRKTNDEILVPVFEKIKLCKTPEEIYQLGIKYRKGEMKDYPHPAGSHEAMIAAFECFRNAKRMGCEKPELYHNIAMIYYQWKKLEDAEAAFLLASAMGLKASQKNLLNLRREIAERDAEAKKSMEQQNLRGMQFTNQALKIFDDLLSKNNLAKMLGSAMDQVLIDSGLDDKTRQELVQAMVKTSNENYESVMGQEIDRARKDTGRVLGGFFSPEPHRVEGSYRAINEIHSFSPAEITESLLREAQLEDLCRVTKCIFESTLENDCVLFLGRSPLLLYEMFSALQLPRKTLCIPYSGGTELNGTKMLKIPEENFSGYKDFLRACGLSEDFFAKHNRLVIVDRVESGKSVLFFRNLLGEINKQFLTSPIVGFGDHTELRVDGKEFIFLTINSETLSETCKKHYDRQKYSLGVDFYPEEWRDWQKKDFNPKPTPIALARKNQIHEWALQNLAPEKSLAM